MDWTQAAIYTTTQGLDPVGGMLVSLGLGCYEIEDAEDFKDFLAHKYGNWDYIDENLLGLAACESCIKVYLPQNAQGAEQLSQIREGLARLKGMEESSAWGRLEVQLQNVSEEDWSTSWKKYYHPIQVSDRLTICPSWEEYEKKSPDEIVLRMDPGMAFGTGTHDTTLLCLRALQAALTPEKSVLDVGTGSGILAIGAALLGAGEVYGCDIDENSVRIAGENAALNGVGERITFRQGDLARDVDGQYDVVTANIVADIILRLIDDIPRVMKPGGTFIASGIIEEREDEILQKLAASGFSVLDCRRSGGWSAIVSTR